MNKIKVIIVDTYKNPRIVEIENTLESLQKIVGGNIEICPLKTNIDMIFNEAGKLIEDMLPNRAWKHNGKIIDVIFGTIIVAGSDEEGNTISLGDDQIKEYMDMFQLNIRVDQICWLSGNPVPVFEA